MPDQMLMYDTAVADWVASTFSGLITGKSLNLTVGTSDRAFAEYCTPSGIDPDGRPPLPRAALTLGDPIRDPERFNSNDLRKLGFVDADKTQLYQAEYPVPVNIPYTLNFWTEYTREMNLHMQQLLKEFRFGYKFIDVDIDSISPVPVYGTKQIGMYEESGISDTGDLEPGNKERSLRRTFDFTLKAWLWDFDFAQAYMVKEFEFQFYRDRDLSLLFEVARTPRRQQLIDANGTSTTYSEFTDNLFLPIIEYTFIIDAVVGGSDVRGFDNGLGSIVGNGINSGTVDYVTGEVTVTYDAPPDNNTDITVAYFTRV